MLVLFKTVLVVCAVALGFRPSPRTTTPTSRTTARKALITLPEVVDALPADVRHLVDGLPAAFESPQARFGCIAAALSAAFASQIARSPLGRQRTTYVRPANVSKVAWRATELGKWRVRAGEGEYAVWFLRQWARQPASKDLPRNAAVEDIDNGVRIRYARSGVLAGSP